MIAPARLSYAVLAATIILAGLLHLGVPLLVVLFSYFALQQLYLLTKRKWLALILFGIVVAGIGTAAVFFTRAAVLALPDVRKRFDELGMEVIGNTPAEFAAVIKTETPQWAKVIKAAGIKAE